MDTSQIQLTETVNKYIMTTIKLPDYDTIKNNASEYAKDQCKNDNCTYQDVRYAQKDFMAGAIWMMKEAEERIKKLL